DAARRGDHGVALAHLRRLSALDPFDSRVVLQLMKVLERAGNGAVALRHARTHQALRQTELGLGEDPSVRAAHNALVARLDRARATGVVVEPVAQVTAVVQGVAMTEPMTEPKPDPVPMSTAPPR